MEYSFGVFNKLAADGLTVALHKLLLENWMGFTTATRTGENADKNPNKKSAASKKSDGTRGVAEQELPPIVLCIGSDLAIGDCLGPVTGSMLKYKTQGLNVFIYGTLAAPVTAKEIGYVRRFLRETHPRRTVIAVDAAVGDEGDIGLIKINDSPLMPGAGANKKLGKIGDVSILGVVAERSLGNYGLFNTTRMNLVYTMSEIISDALANLLWEKHGKLPSFSSSYSAVAPSLSPSFAPSASPSKP